MTVRPLRRTRVAVGLALGALLVSGCASSGDSDPKSPATKTAEELVTSLINVNDEGTPVKGGTLRVAEYSELRSLDPADPSAGISNGAAGGSALTAVYDALMRYDWETKTYVPQLAESLSSDDNIVWTLKLRKDATFSDGTPVNADAVTASIARHTKSYGYGGIAFLSNVEKTEKVDEWTVKFTTRFPWGTFPDILSHGPGLIVAPAAYKDPANFKPIGAGAFVADEYRPGEYRTVKANEKYWDGRPYLDAIKFTAPGGDTQKVEALENGDVDQAFLRDDKLVTKLMKDQPGMRWVIGQGRNVWFNVREGKDTAMKEVRLALQYAWDPELYLKRNGEDASLATKSLFSKTSPWYTGVEAIKPDVEKAKQYVAEAKAKGWDGTLTWAHFADPTSNAQAVNAKAILEAAGIKIELKPITSVADQMKMMYSEHSFDLAVSAFTIPDEDPYLRLMGTTSPTSPTNATGTNNPELSALVTELAAAKDATDGLETMKKIETIWQEDPPGLGTATGLWMAPWGKNVHGINPTVENLLLYSKAWISK